MPSPSSVYYDAVKAGIMTLAQLQAAYADAIQRSLTGNVTSESGGGKTEGRAYDLSSEQAMQNAAFAIQKLTGTLPSRNVVNVLPGCGPCQNGLL
jgi:hypothetical protein